MLPHDRTGKPSETMPAQTPFISHKTKVKVLISRASFDLEWPFTFLVTAFHRPGGILLRTCAVDAHRDPTDPVVRASFICCIASSLCATSSFQVPHKSCRSGGFGSSDPARGPAFASPPAEGAG